MEISRIGFSGAIDRLPEVQGILSGLQPATSGADAQQVEALRSQVSGSLDSLVRELGNEAGPDVGTVDAHLADARAHVEGLGLALGVIDEGGTILGEGPAVEQFCDVSDYLSDIEVAWRNQRPTLLEIQTRLPFRRARYTGGAVAAAVLVIALLWLLLHNQKPQAIAASEAPVFPSPPLSSVPPPSKVSQPPFDTNLHVSSRPNTTPPLTLSLPNETRTRTPGTDFASIDINTMLPTVQPTAAPTGPLIVDPQSVQQSCNETNTFLAPTVYRITNNTGNQLLYSATVEGTWASAAPSGGYVQNGTTTLIGVAPAVDQNGKILACEQLQNTGRRKGDFFLTITINTYPIATRYTITDTISLF